MSERDYRILIGAAGWQHPQWSNDVFYPDDLPEDWYLSFYANEFPVVLVPEAQWADIDAADQVVDEILEQATPGFKCVFELDLTEDRTRHSKLDLRLDKLLQVKPFLSGLLILVDSNGFENKSFCEEIISLQNRFNVCLELKNNPNELELTNIKTFCEQHAMSVCWKGEGEAIVPDAAKLWLARCDSNQDNKAVLQQLKLLIARQLKQESLTREHALIIDGAPPKIDVVRNANIMMDIM